MNAERRRHSRTTYAVSAIAMQTTKPMAKSVQIMWGLLRCNEAILRHCTISVVPQSRACPWRELRWQVCKFSSSSPSAGVVITITAPAIRQAEARSRPTILSPRSLVASHVYCKDKATGAPRAASTVTVSASTRQAAVNDIERMIRNGDVCQENGDVSRVTVPGSGRYLD